MSSAGNLARPFQKARQFNSTDTTFPVRAPQVTPLVQDAAASGLVQEVFSFVEGGNGPVPFAAFIVPYGLGAALDAFDMRVIGWKKIGTDPNLTLRVPFILGSYTCTLCTAVGVAGSPVLATEHFCDTITIISEPTVTADVTRGGTTHVYSPTGNLLAWVRVPLRGCEQIEVTFANRTNTPTKNALVSFLHDEF